MCWRSRSGCVKSLAKSIRSDGGFCEIGSQQLRELTGKHRTAEIVALRHRAAVLLKKSYLISCFHTFRHNPHMQTLPHADHRVDDTGIVSIGSEIAHERLINLLSIDRKTPQVA